MAETSPTPIVDPGAIGEACAVGSTPTPSPSLSAQAQLASESDLRIASLSDSQCYELAHLHRIRGMTPQDLATRWATWSPHELSRALRSSRVEKFLEIIESDARSTAGSVLAYVNLTAFETAERYVKVAQGKARYENDEGNSVPFSEKAQTEAMRWQLDHVLPDKPQVQVNTGPVFNNTIVAGALTDAARTMEKIRSLLPGAGVSGNPATALSGDGPSGDGSASGSMSRFIRKGREQLIKDDDVPLTIDVPSS